MLEIKNYLKGAKCCEEDAKSRFVTILVIVRFLLLDYNIYDTINKLIASVNKQEENNYQVCSDPAESSESRAPSNYLNLIKQLIPGS